MRSRDCKLRLISHAPKEGGKLQNHDEADRREEEEETKKKKSFSFPAFVAADE